MSDESSPAPPPASGDGAVEIPPPNGGGGGGSEPMPAPGGPSRRPNLKRILLAVGAIALLIGGGAVFVLGGAPAVPSLGGCNADVPNATFATYQHAGQSGKSVDLQLTHIENGDEVLVMVGDEDVARMTGVGNTTTVTGLSSGDTIKYVGETKCGTHVIGTYTVK